MLDSENNIKLTDFGFARYFRDTDIFKTFCGSAAYAPPEILQGIPYNPVLHDIWALGVILYNMVTIFPIVIHTHTHACTQVQSH